MSSLGLEPRWAGSTTRNLATKAKLGLPKEPSMKIRPSLLHKTPNRKKGKVIKSKVASATRKHEKKGKKDLQAFPSRLGSRLLDKALSRRRNLAADTSRILRMNHLAS
jgi:hypothetical protein